MRTSGTSSTECDNPPSGYAKLPNAQWSYESSTQLWRASFPATTFPAGSYVAHAVNSTDGSKATPVTFTLSSACSWSAVVPGPVTPPPQSCSQNNAGATTNYSGYTWTCTCP